MSGLTNARTLRVSCSERSYDVHVGTGMLDELGRLMRACVQADAAFVVSDSNVAPLYLERCLHSLMGAGVETASLTIPAGEQHKRLETFGRIVEAMAEAGLTRSSVVVALGGGVVGDMAGFAAASYMRGIQVVQVPTTLLSMVDSSVGGKTAIDLAAGKNLVGAFLQPSLVVADVDTLSSLRREVFVDGMGEVVKHAVLADERLFDQLLEHPVTQGGDGGSLTHMVARNVEIKREVVAADEREAGIRQTLNLGHTIGHAVEASSGFALGHGHCVAIGLCAIARASEALGWAPKGMARRIEDCVAAQGLPIDTDLDHETLHDFACHDKKRRSDRVSLVVPDAIGSVHLHKVGLTELREVIDLGCGTSTRRA